MMRRLSAALIFIISPGISSFFLSGRRNGSFSPPQELSSSTKFYASNRDSFPNPEELSRQKAEVLDAVSDFHDGVWECKEGALSFTITSDVAAGITSKRISVPYITTSSLRMGPTNDPYEQDSIRMVETFTWEAISSPSCCVAVRTIPWDQSVDVDSVDSSYSFDVATNAHSKCVIPLEISGQDPTTCVFFIEKVLALSNHERIRVAILYEPDPHVSASNCKLARIVICREERRDDKSSAESSINPIHVLEPVSLFTLSLGPWLGDIVIRDRRSTLSGFAKWIIGVQKVAMRFDYDFGSSIKNYWDYGRSLGASVVDMPLASKGMINESGMSRRIPLQERILYIDYDAGSYAAFLVSSVFIKAPRFMCLTEDSSLMESGKQHKHSEFMLFHTENQSTNTTGSNKPELFCSRMTRLYNSRGLFVQGSTSFFTLQPKLEN